MIFFLDTTEVWIKMGFFVYMISFTTSNFEAKLVSTTVFCSNTFLKVILHVLPTPRDVQCYSHEILELDFAPQACMVVLIAFSFQA